LRGHRFFAAGVPWYVALFGRDTLIASLETLAFEPGVVADTLRLLLRETTDAALDWIAAASRAAGGYLAYATSSQKGLTNQGWKDSADAIVNADGSLARPPIALSEVQGYVYLAKASLADVRDRIGDGAAADGLRQEADDLRRRFNGDFWLPDRGIYALALRKTVRRRPSSAPTRARCCGRASPRPTRRTPRCST
jgi:glycogen debranching enzyme